jgi:hypothetical protein
MDQKRVPQTQMQQPKYGEHDWHGHERRARDDHEGHVAHEGKRKQAEQARQRDPFLARQHDDRIGQRHRAERELLALVDIILDENAVRGDVFAFSVRSGKNATIQDITTIKAQDTRKAMKTHNPRCDRAKCWNRNGSTRSFAVGPTA